MAALTLCVLTLATAVQARTPALETPVDIVDHPMVIEARARRAALRSAFEAAQDRRDRALARGRLRTLLSASGERAQGALERKHAALVPSRRGLARSASGHAGWKPASRCSGR